MFKRKKKSAYIKVKKIFFSDFPPLLSYLKFKKKKNKNDRF